jgi:hypothetical protein
MIQKGHQAMGQPPVVDTFAEGIKAKVATGELAGAEGQRLIAERWGVDLARVQGHPRGLTLFDATATQAYDDYLAHNIPPAELKQHLRGHEFFVPFPVSKGA